MLGSILLSHSCGMSVCVCVCVCVCVLGIFSVDIKVRNRNVSICCAFSCYLVVSLGNDMRGKEFF